MFSYISLEERVPQAHPLRKLRAVVDALLATMNCEFEAVYARRGRPSVPPEMLLKALLLQILFSIRSERQLVEAVTLPGSALRLCSFATGLHFPSRSPNRLLRELTPRAAWRTRSTLHAGMVVGCNCSSACRLRFCCPFPD